MNKRENYINWDEYFMGVALLSAKRSKDPNTQVGACIDDSFPWAKQGEFLETKYAFVCHAELNAILNNIGMDLHGCRIYTALFPCNECTKSIIQSGIIEVIYLSDKYEGTDSSKASRMMLNSAGVTCRKVNTNIKNLVLSFNESDV